ncbi:hypothetical protein BDQ17DRAFT_1360929 [Cyathus striatus]|nr:hypothetical protein BDQ17DRAFT_1360929 [Cyathus striatus]
MLSNEITWIWNSKWSWNRIKVLYIVTRYSIIIDLILFVLPHIFPRQLGLHATGCQPNKVLLYMVMLVATIGTLVAQAILSISTLAILGQNRAYKAFLMVIFVSSAIGTAVTLGLYLNSVQLDTNGCLVSSEDALTWILAPYAIFLILSTIHIILLSIEPVRACYYGGRSQLLWTIYHNGLFYYCGMFALCLSSITITVAVNHNFWTFLAYMYRTFSAVTICRLVIHTRRNGHQGTGTRRMLELESSPTRPIIFDHSQEMDTNI